MTLKQLASINSVIKALITQRMEKNQEKIRGFSSKFERFSFGI